MENENNSLETAVEMDQHPTVHPFTQENLIGIKGRMNRLDFAILTFGLVVLSWAIQKSSGINPMLIPIQLMMDPQNVDQLPALFGIMTIFGIVVYAYFSVKRFHDIGYPSHMAFIFLAALLPLGGILALLLGFVIFVLKLILLFAPGNPKANEFGSTPAPNHRNKILLLFIVLFAIFMLYSSFMQEAMPVIEPLVEQMMEEAGA